ncbi:glycoside hydrolase family 57 protein [Candidatus Nomurabacteria bacterium]|nr:glycoside hydrolase family 57 protein [Candidatus Nomurabacteria bacterium]USN94696.1 MAG: polysaccharide deacetylase family protein [Candidatus Nomurabacteria bacterium]
MMSICLYLHVHQPFRIKKYNAFSIGNDRDYFGDFSDTSLNNEKVLYKVAEKSYIPTNKVLLELLNKHPEFRFSMSISGTVLEQFEKYHPEVLKSFQDLVKTGRVELVADTFYHSLAFFYSREEFERQVDEHHKILKRLFKKTPKVFRNTELSYNNELAKWADQKGYKAILAEGWDPILGWRSPNFVYRPKGTKKIKLLMKNYRLSDDIAFRFGEKSWAGWPLDASKFASWVLANHGSGETINLFMDYETFGEHQWEDTGIFDFLRHFPGEILSHQDTTFRTISETAKVYQVRDEVDVPHTITWADTERDLTAWIGNDIQRAALESIYKLEQDILKTKNKELIKDWKYLQTSDHFYYMCTKWWKDGDVHAYFSPYSSPYDAYISFMNVINDVKLRLEELKAS